MEYFLPIEPFWYGGSTFRPPFTWPEHNRMILVWKQGDESNWARSVSYADPKDLEHPLMSHRYLYGFRFKKV